MFNIQTYKPKIYCYLHTWEADKWIGYHHDLISAEDGREDSHSTSVYLKAMTFGNYQNYSKVPIRTFL